MVSITFGLGAFLFTFRTFITHYIVTNLSLKNEINVRAALNFNKTLGKLIILAFLLAVYGVVVSSFATENYVLSAILFSAELCLVIIMLAVTLNTTDIIHNAIIRKQKEALNSD
ncbi:hypothetical protein [Facilibium subflavum]|uniref:hypothetical protein n=1 Tax=Facilibium subflavum TaxID=2219058 RepID=UPI000E648DFA|nr:hypothetical protein [Facilibium subflavum]